MKNYVRGGQGRDEDAIIRDAWIVFLALIGMLVVGIASWIW